MSTRDLLTVLFKRKWVLLCFFAAVLVGVYAALKLVSPTYQATARLLVRLGQEDLYMPVLPSSQFRSPVMSVVREEQLRSEANILADGELARKVVAELTPQRLFPGIDVVHPWYTPKGVVQALVRLYNGLEDHFFPLSAQRSLEDKAVAAFERGLKAEAVKSSNLIEVSLRNKSPEAAALGVNTLVQVYLRERVRLYQREQAGFFSGQLAQLNQQIQEAEAALARQRSQGQVLDLERQRGAQVDSLNDVRKRLDDNRVLVSQLSRRVQVLRQQLASVPATLQTGGAESSNAQALSELGKQLAEIRRQEADIEQRFSANDPRLAGLREQRKALQALVDEQQKQRTQSLQQGPNPLSTRVRDDLLQAEAALAGAQQDGASLQALQAQVAGRVDSFNHQDASHQQLTQRLKVLRDSRQLYLEKAEESRLSAAQAAAQLGNVSVVSQAEVDRQPVSPKLWLVLVGALVGGLLGGIGLAFLLEALDDSLRDDADVQRALGLPLLAKLPPLPPLPAAAA